ncbi:hypothetical protein QIW53_18920 [Pseudomonas fluorescens]|uniref:hypothetical protein n=1 Tax=Pseudomonas fluorescens TaxID=294 RepID=UPI0035248C4F
MSLPDIMTDWCLGVVGNKLLSVNALLHVFGSERSSAPQEISLQFENAQAGRIYCGSDGFTLCLSNEPIIECDLGEYGELTNFCISDDGCFADFIGLRLLSASVIQSSACGKIIGINFLFESDCCLSILNLGDELFVYEEIPQEIIASEDLELIPLS